MPGRNLVLRTTSDETAAVAKAAVAQLARRLTLHLSDEDIVAPEGGADVAPRETAQALTVLHLLEHIHKAAEQLQRAAALTAARAGAGYPQIGDACGMTRQGARRRWPGLFDHSDAAPMEHR
ncbi:hypothetical protein [Streptomyces sp. Qhu_M48]|uniref:hypothetical protein n=1 Tax=Streptomyces sp. Qhu_M48 TaxID=3435889 RepID=UPI003F503D09